MKKEFCEYIMVDKDILGYQSSCGELVACGHGCLEENDLYYCPYCGKKIKVELELN